MITTSCSQSYSSNLKKSVDFTFSIHPFPFWEKRTSVWSFLNVISISPSTLMGDQDHFSLQPLNNIKQTSDDNKDKSQWADYWLIQFKILWSDIMRSVWQTAKRITKWWDLGSKRVQSALIIPDLLYCSIFQAWNFYQKVQSQICLIMFINVTQLTDPLPLIVLFFSTQPFSQTYSIGLWKWDSPRIP